MRLSVSCHRKDRSHAVCNVLKLPASRAFPIGPSSTFDHGVTAIVGPNGCGKSNVVDAITWVLGEQSAKSLRGDRMEDVIFSGSDARKPTAAAEVRLRLERRRLRAVAAATAMAATAAASGRGMATAGGICWPTAMHRRARGRCRSSCATSR